MAVRKKPEPDRESNEIRLADAAESAEGPETRILRSMRQIIRAIDLHSKKLIGEHGITGPQLVTLLCVAQESPITPSEIGKRVHLSNSTLVGILDRLERGGLVQRSRSNVDRRNVFITCTDRGHALAKEAPSPLQDRLATALRMLHPTDQVAIATSLERVVDLMGAENIDAAPMLHPGSELPSSNPES